MKKYLWISAMCLITQQLKAQIKTSEILVEPTNNVTTINGQLGVGINDPQDLVHVADGNIRIGTDAGDYGIVHYMDGAMNIWNRWSSNDAFVRIGAGFDLNSLTVKGDGNVGIGTFNPEEKLHVNGSVRGNATGGALRIQTATGFIDIGSVNNGFSHFYTDRPGFYFDKKVVMNGYVGIGITNPQDYLHLPDGNLRIGTDAGDYGQIYYSGGGMTINNRWLSDAAFINIGAGNNPDVLKVMGSGQVGIGIQPTAKLHVNGTIKAPATDWSDFVFDEGYELPTLREVEKHIQDHGHLKDIPSEAEVMENHVDLTQMDSRLLQKIEELTLYLIEQNKKIEALQEKVKLLEEK